VTSDPNPPTWRELVCQVAAEQADTLLERLSALGCDQVWVDQPLTNERVPDGWFVEPSRASVVTVHVFPAPERLASLPDELADLVQSTYERTVAVEDWLTSWRESRRVITLADGWCFAPPWLAETTPDRARTVVIDPGLAFGVGDHPTTRDTALLLLGAGVAGGSVLDLGAGSGVLSILARRLGAARVVAVEIDELAAREIPRNAELNQVTGIEVHCGDAAGADLPGPFDVILVNIGAREAKALAAQVDRLAATGARIILSGITAWSIAAVDGVYAGLGWRTRRRRRWQSEWVTSLLARESAAGAAVRTS